MPVEYLLIKTDKGCYLAKYSTVTDDIVEFRESECDRKDIDDVIDGFIEDRCVCVVAYPEVRGRSYYHMLRFTPIKICYDPRDPKVKICKVELYG